MNKINDIKALEHEIKEYHALLIEKDRKIDNLKKQLTSTTNSLILLKNLLMSVATSVNAGLFVVGGMIYSEASITLNVEKRID